MTTITIPKKLAKQGDLVVIPREEYESLKRKSKSSFSPTLAQKRALARAENNFRKGNSLSYAEFEKRLGITG